MTKEREGELLMLGLSMLESWFPILSIVAMSYVGALHTYMYSLMVALVFFLAIMYQRKRFGELKNKAAYKDLLLTTFWITLIFTLIFVGMRYTTAGNMAVIVFLQVLFSYLYFNVLGHEKMEKMHLAGAVIMTLGALIILIPEDFALNKGDLLILASAAMAPIVNLYQKRAREHCSAETILGFRTLVGLPFVALMAYLFEPAVNLEAFISALPYIFLIATGVYVVSKIMWIEALNRIAITKLSAMLALLPVMTLFFAYLYLDEVPQIRQLAGIIPVLIGGYLITKPLKSAT
ncbi:MAG TPA: DMT family transporter [Sulfurovum sp.]|nr:MAG: EamA family transporter [Sulfurovum sp. 35-42-20]OYY55911.1 MAG: EamA family transporter [Sulfurovum sp. 28-43-6]OYZ23912.1 MAG: EamA family transporter [Sulfurovum sp. 16-42-52]OYZ47901.1 MAG: EamA family transporter [Sulfurovum sp. 24-42-9]OZA43840.1 MAG: EamA family transporter [Sulfurovum sp. 17-42-90]OZA61139.1 MAG: EamA family transporter [Sulfurovum sp. 39-42-12]HQR74292.1 DMT family transporter [Sulfurovum sp.]